MNQQMFTSSRYCYIISACILNADGFFAKNDIQLWTLQRILPKRSVASCDIAYYSPEILPKRSIVSCDRAYYSTKILPKRSVVSCDIAYYSPEMECCLL